MIVGYMRYKAKPCKNRKIYVAKPESEEMA
jgi:hypothetical protein